MDAEEKGLAQRIVNLEAELIAQKAVSKDLKQDATARQHAEENLKHQVQEAVATKEDLLGNMEAQQREFEVERRHLEAENSRLNVKLEDLEDEFDRMLSNEEHEGKLHALQDEIDRLRHQVHNAEEDRTDHLARCQSEIGRLKEVVQQHHMHDSKLGEKVDELTGQLHHNLQNQRDQEHSLRTTWVQLGEDSDPPEDLAALTSNLGSVVEKSMAHQKEIETSLKQMREQNADLDSRLHSQTEEAYTLRRQTGHL